MDSHTLNCLALSGNHVLNDLDKLKCDFIIKFKKQNFFNINEVKKEDINLSIEIYSYEETHFDFPKYNILIKDQTLFIENFIVKPIKGNKNLEFKPMVILKDSKGDLKISGPFFSTELMSKEEIRDLRYEKLSLITILFSLAIYSVFATLKNIKELIKRDEKE